MFLVQGQDGLVTMREQGNERRGCRNGKVNRNLWVKDLDKHREHSAEIHPRSNFNLTLVTLHCCSRNIAFSLLTLTFLGEISLLSLVKEVCKRG